MSSDSLTVVSHVNLSRGTSFCVKLVLYARAGRGVCLFFNTNADYSKFLG